MRRETARAKRSTKLAGHKLERPSRINNYPWVFAENRKPAVKGTSSNHSETGKWLIYISFKGIDGVWKKIKAATEKGRLGPKSKCSTAMGQPRGIRPDEGVIVVYTKDWVDIKDVFRVENAIRKLAISQTLYYKTDEATLAGKYSKLREGGVSKYISKGKGRSTQSKRRGWLSLDNIQGIGPKLRMHLNEEGFKSLKSLIKHDEATLAKVMNWNLGRARLIHLRARALYHNSTVFIKPLSEIGENPLIMDIETDLGGNFIWMIGIYAYEANAFKQLIVYTPRQEPGILAKCCKILTRSKSKKILIFSGSRFDERILRKRLDHHRMVLSANITFADILIDLRHAIALPIKSYSLDSLAPHIGFKFRHPNIDGLQMALIYSEWQRNLRKCPHLSMLIDKNEDDVMALKRIIDEFYES